MLSFFCVIPSLLPCPNHCSKNRPTCKLLYVTPEKVVGSMAFQSVLHSLYTRVSQCTAGTGVTGMEQCTDKKACMHDEPCRQTSMLFFVCPIPGCETCEVTMPR